MARYAAWLNGLVTPALVARDLLVEAPLVHPRPRLRRARARGGGRLARRPVPGGLRPLAPARRGGRRAHEPARARSSRWRESAGPATRTDPRYALARHVALKCAYLAARVLGRAARGRALGRRRDRARPSPTRSRAEGIRVALFVEVDRKKIGRTVRGRAGHRRATRSGASRGLPLLVAVGAPGARHLIRAELARAGFREPDEFRCVA